VLHEVLGDERKALVRADEGLDARPLAFEPLLLAPRLVFREFFYFRVDLWLFALITFQCCV
jgi:hypothetical protein